MKNLKFLAVSLLAFCSVFVFAATNQDEYKAEFRFNHGQGFQQSLLGTQSIRNQTRALKVQYSFAKSGGAISTISLPVPATPGYGGSLTGALPKNAIVVGCFIDVITTVTSGGAATLAFGTGQTGVDLLAATAKGSFTAGSILACIPVGTAATAIKLTADRVPSVTIAAAALTAGVINLHIQYVLSDQ